MNELMKFENTEVEIIDINREPYFEVYSVGMALGQVVTAKGTIYPNKERINNNLKNAEIQPVLRNAKLYISESQLYDLMLEMKTDKVKPFRKWLVTEVLPSIRKTGGYVNNDDLFINTYLPNADEQTKLMFKSQLSVIKNLNGKIEQDKPKVIFADAVSVSSTSISVADMAKLLKQNGINTGQQRFFEWLRSNGYLIRRKGTDYNAPTQRSMELRLFETKETSITHSDGHITVRKTPKVTGKGQIYFINKFKEGNHATNTGRCCKTLAARYCNNNKL